MNHSLYIKAFFAFLVVFGSGALSGSLVVVKSMREEQRQPPCTKSLSERMTAHLTAELNLSDQQQKEILPYIQRTCDDLGTIHRQALGNASAAIEACHAVITPFLGPVQAAKLAQCESKRQQFLAMECGYQRVDNSDCAP